MKKNRLIKRMLAALAACLMLASTIPVALALSDDWRDLQIGVQWTDENGEMQEALAAPVEESEGSFWVQVPMEAISKLTLIVSHPNHDYMFTPGSGETLADTVDAGRTTDGPYQMIQAADQDHTERFFLFVSTSVPAPIAEKEEPEPEEEPVQEEPEEEPEQEPEEEPVQEEPEEEPEQEPEEEPVQEPEEEPVQEEPEEEPEQEPEEEPVQEEPEEEPEQEPEEEPVQEPEEEPVQEEPEEEPEQMPAEEPRWDETADEAEQKAAAEPVPDEPEKNPAQERQEEQKQPEKEQIMEITPMPETELLGVDLGAYESLYGETIEETADAPATPESTPMPVETPIPMGEMINRYGRTTDNKVAIRSEMTQKGKDKNVLKRVEKGSAVYMLQERMNDNGQKWVAVLYDGKVAYMMSEYLSAMTQAESDAYMNENGFIAPVSAEELAAMEKPVVTPTPEPTKVPEQKTQKQKDHIIEPEAKGDSAPENQKNPDEPETNHEDDSFSKTIPDETDRQEEQPGEVDRGEEATEEPTETPTQEPTEEPEPTPVETPIPFGEMINRFGKTNVKQVVVRRNPTKKAKALKSGLKKGTEVYMVREVENEAGEHWTEVLIKGKTGYIQSELLTVMTGAESDAYMATLGSPVPPVIPDEPTEAPTETPEPTEEPTATPKPTEEPTATPKPTEEPTATPEPTEAPTATMEPTEEPTATPEPTEEPTATQEPTEEPTATPKPTEEPTATPKPTEEPTAPPKPTEKPTATPTAVYTAEPPQVTGYAITIGDGAYVRNWPSSNSVIMDELPGNKVVFVNAQTYTDAVAWHQVQYSGQVGYIRADMLRMMSQNEVIEYLDKQKATPKPTAVITVQPYDPDSLSSYGYTTTTVNFREKASKNSARIRQLKKFAFCLVLGSTEVNGETWYRVNYDGKTGYIDGHYFKQMTLSELENFLGSADYLEGISGNASTSTSSSGKSSSSTSSSSTKVVSAEDQKVSTWTNPESGIVVSYEPFDPFATAAPLATEEPSEYLDSLVKDMQNGVVSQEQIENLLKNHYQGMPDQERLVNDGMAYILAQIGDVPPTDTPVPSPESEPSPTPEIKQEETQGSNAAGWIIGIAAVLAAGGGGYAWYSGQQRKRKAAQAAAQKRAAQVRRQQGNAGIQGSAAAVGKKTSEQNPTTRSRTGTYTEQNGRPSAQPTSTEPNQAMQRKPYGSNVENPYARYSTRGSDDSNNNLNYRPEGSREQEKTEERNPYRSEYRQNDGNTTGSDSYRPQNDLREEKTDRTASYRAAKKTNGEEATYSASYRTEENRDAMNATSRRRNRTDRYSGNSDT